MKNRNPIAHIEILEREEGLFVAQCPELGLMTEGASIVEAEAALMRLIEERVEQLGHASAPEAIESERDARLTEHE